MRFHALRSCAVYRDSSEVNWGFCHARLLRNVETELTARIGEAERESSHRTGLLAGAAAVGFDSAGRRCPSTSSAPGGYKRRLIVACAIAWLGNVRRLPNMYLTLISVAYLLVAARPDRF
jgi:hypothetical protein